MNELSTIGGPINLAKFGLFRSFVQTLITSTRINVCNSRRDAMLGAFRAFTSEAVCELPDPLDVTVMFSKRQYKT